LDDETVSFEYRDVYVTDDNNVPKIGDDKADYMDYADQILTGFDRTLSFFKNNIDSLRSQIRSFSHVQVRILMNATMQYTELYSYTSHPNYMSDMLMLDKLFENLWTTREGEDTTFYLHELRDAHNCDVPIFHTYPDSTSLFASDGTEIKDYYTHTSLDLVENRLDNMEAEFEFEAIILRKTLGKHITDERAHSKASTQRLKFVGEPAEPPLNPVELLLRINSDIEKRLKVVNNTVSWMELAENDFLEYGIPDYYNGSSGLGLYLEQCRKANIPLGDGLEKALAAINSMILRAEFAAAMDTLSAKSGFLSTIKLLLFKYLNTRDVAYWEQIELRIRHLDFYVNNDIPQQVETNTVLHVPSLILLIVRLYWVRPSAMMLSLIDKLGHLMIEQMYLHGLADNELGERIVASSLLKALFPAKEAFASLYDFISSFVLKPSVWNESGFEQGPVKIGMEDGALQRFGSYLVEAGKITGDMRYETCLKTILPLIDQRTPPLTDTLSSGVCADLDFLLNLYTVNREPEMSQRIHHRVRLLANGYSINGALRVKYGGILPKIGLFDGMTGIGYSLLRSLNLGLESPLT
jgi:lantibiotic modifying enzyme